MEMRLAAIILMDLASLRAMGKVLACLRSSYQLRACVSLSMCVCMVGRASAFTRLVSSR